MVTPASLPRLMVAAAASSAGKTTVSAGLMAALTGQGCTVAGFKVGPDFIDPGYHSLATGRPGRNLDPVLTSEELVPRLLLHGAGIRTAAPRAPERAAGEPDSTPGQPPPADLAIIEGVMGLFDGRLGTDGFGSTAHLARLLAAPVLLVADASGSSRTAAAVALGLRAFDPRITIAAVVVNRVASPRHGAELARAFEAAGMPVLGLVPRNAGISAPSRHLGLVPAAERPESAATLAALAEQLAAHVDLAAVRDVAATAPKLAAEPWNPRDVVRRVGAEPVIGVLAGRAFTFRYTETTELLAAAGCRVVELDPLTETALPPGICALYAGGGFPQVHAVELGGNAALRADIAAAVADGLPTVAECAGQLYLGDHLDGHPMVGVLPAAARMTPRLTLGYRVATAPADTLLATAGARVSGHEFHRTQLLPGSGPGPAWKWDGRTEGFSVSPAGGTRPSVHASYLHTHWAGYPELAQRFAEAASGFARSTAGSTGPSDATAHPLAPTIDETELPHHTEPHHTEPHHTEPHATANPTGATPAQAPDSTAPEPRPHPAQPTTSSPRGKAAPRRSTSHLAPIVDGIDLHHHGDQDLASGLVDLAVNVMLSEPPPWLAAEIARLSPPLGGYPDAGPARAAIAARHGVDPAMVLPTAGGAEAFSLIARALPLACPLVVHPQFTEPEAALRAAGAAVQRWLLPVAPNPAPPALDGLPDWADALFVGNPTNPTGWLYPGGTLLGAASGRLLVVDEAFMDATDEAESLIATEMPGRLVLRSLSKTWGLAGLRVGYVVGDPALIGRLETVQPPWAVSSPALAAMVATSTPAALAEARERYTGLAGRRERFIAGLRAAGFGVAGADAPFVLIDTSPCGRASVRPALARAGFAVRRGESFPGLGPTWIRVRVPDAWDEFVAALGALARE